MLLNGVRRGRVYILYENPTPNHGHLFVVPSIIHIRRGHPGKVARARVLARVSYLLITTNQQKLVR